MSLLLTLDPCGHRQLLLEIGETIPAAVLVPWCTYPIDTGTSIDPGDEMTCITCCETRIVRSTA